MENRENVSRNIRKEIIYHELGLVILCAFRLVMRFSEEEEMHKRTNVNLDLYDD